MVTTGRPQYIEIFVTHVAEDGLWLKIWGQLDRAAATFVERLIEQYKDQFVRGVGVVHPSTVTVGQLCCALYGVDNVYYRAKITDISGAQQGFVRVEFIDYGNADIISVSNIRSLNFISTSPLCSIQNLATEFTLAGVLHPSGVAWDEPSIDFIRDKLCYAEFRCAIVAQITGRRLITLYYNDTDFAEILIQKGIALRLALHAQQGMLQNMHLYSNLSAPNFNVPPPVPVGYNSNANVLVKTAALTKQETGVISAPMLFVGSKHSVYISYVEDGPYLFAVQLKSTENILHNMTKTFSTTPLKPFSQSPIPGSVCVSLLTHTKVLCRAVVTNLMEKECVVYCVDFGNTETVPFSQIFEVPQQFLNTKSLAMRFSIAGLQNMTFDDKAKREFQELVTGQILTLDVVEPEGPPLKQYGNVYLETGENVLHVLKERMRSAQKAKAYPPLPVIQPGRIVNVTVSYVESIDNFYVQYDANAKALSKIMSTMEEFCTNNGAMIRPEELYIGMPVCSLFSADHQWYRARILSVSGDEISVFYVDYGNTDCVNLMSLRHMDANLSQVQVQAVACSLSGFETIGAAMDELSTRFEEITLEKKLTMKILENLANGKLLVELHDTSVAPVVNIILLLKSPPKPAYEETPIDEWHDPAAGEPVAEQATTTHFGGKDKRSSRKSKDTKHKKNVSSKGSFSKFGRREDGGGEGWRSDNRKGGGGWDDSSGGKRWGNREDRNRGDKKWNKNEQDGDDNKRWNREDNEGNSGWESREGRGSRKWESSEDRGNRKWESNDKGSSDKGWGNREREDGERRWKGREDRDKRGFSKDNGDWKDRENNRRGFNKDNEDWKDRENNRRGFNKDSDDWKDNRKGFGKEADDRRDNKRGFSKDGENRSWRKRDDEGQGDKKWWEHDDRGDPEKKWGSRNIREDGDKRRTPRDDGEDQRERKWGGRDKQSGGGDFKKQSWNDGGNRRNDRGGDTWKDVGGAASSNADQNWKTTENTVKLAATEDDWDTNAPPSAVETTDWGKSAKAYPDAVISISTKTAATLVYADDPTNFVLQLDDKITDLTKMMEKIASIYESGGKVLPEANQKLLIPCVARYSEDSTWYRAVITSAPINSVTEVRFVDYGNHESVPSSDIKEVVPEFLNIPLFGIPCCLFAVQVPIAEWSPEQIADFLNAADGKQLESQFIKKSGPLFEVILVDTEDPSTTVNEKFGATKENIEKGISNKTSFSTAQKVPLGAPSCGVTAEAEVTYATSEECFKDADIEANVTDNVSVTWFMSPGQFYCQRRSSQPEFASMVNQIQQAYKGRPAVQGEVTVGSPVIARFPADKVLYRAVVKEAGLMYKVQYIDYGNTELLALSNIWQIEKQFMVLPKQGIMCSLKGIQPVESEWPKDSSEFERLFGVDTLECMFHETEGEKHSVSLSANGKDVAEELVSCGLAAHKVEEKVVKEEPFALNLLKGQLIPAHVTFIENVSRFFVHLDPVVAKNVEEEVTKHVKETEKHVPLTDMVEHQMCLATPDGTVWHRGKIIDTSGTVGVCVRFVDFGDSDDVPIDKIRPIPDALMGYRHQATECFVSGSDTSEGNEVEETFKLEVEAQDVILLVEDVIKERLSVHLFDIEGQRLELLKVVDKTSPLDVEPLTPLPILTQTMRMWASHIEGVNAIWLQKESEVDTLTGLLELLFNFYEENAKGIEMGDPQEEQLCAAKSSKDGSWYRAKIQSMTEEEVTVLYIDYGNSETVPRNDVKELDPSFYRIHSMAVCGSLPVMTQDPEACLAELEKSTTEIVFDTSFARDDDGKWAVHLENNETNIVQLLCAAGLASEKTESLFQSAKVTLPANERIDISISHFESPSDFWVQMDSNFVDILDLQENLQTVGPNQALLQTSDVGTLCIAQDQDEAWYRARIIGNNEAAVKVIFLDYGNSRDIDIKSLRKLPCKFFRWPFFAVRCTLPEDTFSGHEELVEKCAELLSNTEAVFQLQVLENTDPAKVSLFVGEKDLLTAVLEVKSVKDESESTPSESEGVFISYGFSPDKFWVQKESGASTLQNMADSLIEASNFNSCENIQLGNIYAALFPEDEQWYRAKVMEISENNYQVLFIDYGNLSSVTELRELPQELAEIPALATCCCLQLPPGVESWSDEAVKKFVELGGEGAVLFNMHLLSTQESSEVKLLLDEENVTDILGELCRSAADLSVGGAHAVEGAVPSSAAVFVSHGSSPAMFWVQRESIALELESMADSLAEAANFNSSENVLVGNIYAALFEDELWYRAKIQELCEDSYFVLFIDYGNSSFVTDLRDLPLELADKPALATCCRLQLPSGVDSWTVEASNKFAELRTVPLQMQLLSNEEPYEVKLLHNGVNLTDILGKLNISATKTSGTGENGMESIGTAIPEAVFVSHISSPAKFWIQKESGAIELESMTDSLAESANFEPSVNIQVGNIYAALFEDDEQWYRAKIQELHEESYHVLFIDYGNSSLVTDLRDLPQELVDKSPLAMCCCLHLPPCVESWSVEADKKFVELSGEGTELFQAQFLSSEEPYEVKLLHNGKDMSSILGDLCMLDTKPALSNGSMEVTISHLNQPTEFWIQWVSEFSNLESIVDSLLEAENFDPLPEASNGLLCVAQFPDDEMWYRSRIVSCQEQCVEVLFIDYGNSALVSDLQSIPEDLASVPPLAKRCSLALPSGWDRWPEQAEEEFMNIFGDGSNTYELSILEEGDPCIVSLKFNGVKVEDILQKACGETGSDKLCSSSDVEILSENEVAINSSSGEESTIVARQKSSQELEQSGGRQSSVNMAENILAELLESSTKSVGAVADNGFEKPVGESLVQKNGIKVIDLKEENVKSESVVGSVVDEIIEISTSGKFETTTSKVVSAIVSGSSASPKRGEITTVTPKHGVEHREQIIRDLSVQLQMPSKGPSEVSGIAISSPGTGSPVRKLSHAERIVPGSISRGLSQTELDISAIGRKELTENATSRKGENITSPESMGINVVVEQEPAEKSGEVNKLNTDGSRDLSEIEHDGEILSVSSEQAEGKSEGTKSPEMSTPLGSSPQRNKATNENEFGDVRDDPFDLSEGFGKSTPLSGSPQKREDPGNGESQAKGDVSSSVSDSNSVSTISSSPRKDVLPVEQESENYVDASSSFDGSFSSSSSTVIQNSVIERTENIDVGVQNHQTAQMHISEEIYESSKGDRKTPPLEIDKKTIQKTMTEKTSSPTEEKQN